MKYLKRRKVQRTKNEIENYRLNEIFNKHRPQLYKAVPDQGE